MTYAGTRTQDETPALSVRTCNIGFFTGGLVLSILSFHRSVKFVKQANI